MTIRQALQGRIFGDDEADPTSVGGLALDIAAFLIAARRGSSIEVRRQSAIDAAKLLPASATHFETGLTVGLCLALLTEPASLAPHLREALDLLDPTLRGQHPSKARRGQMRAAVQRLRRAADHVEAEAEGHRL